MNQGYIVGWWRSCASPQNPGCRRLPSRILLFEEQNNMNHPPIGSKRTVALAGAILLCGSMGLAQVGQQPSSPAGQNPGQTNPAMDSRMNGMAGTGQPSMTDKMFVRRAMEGSMAEIQLGQLTLQKSNNDQVKQFAQRMIDDHTKLNDQMKPVAQQLGVSAPNQVSKKDRKTMDKLQALSGPAYDEAYIRDMVKDHKQDLSDFQGEASSGQDQTAKDAATQGSQVISQHLQMIQQIAKDQNINMASK
jgi:putative membrane protein